MSKHVVRMEEFRIAFKMFTSKPRGNTSLGMPKRKCKDLIRIGLKEIGINIGIELIQFRIGIIGKPL